MKTIRPFLPFVAAALTFIAGCGDGRPPVSGGRGAVDTKKTARKKAGTPEKVRVPEEEDYPPEEVARRWYSAAAAGDARRAGSFVAGAEAGSAALIRELGGRGCGRLGCAAR